MEWTVWIPTAFSLLIVIVVFVMRHSIKVGIEKGVQHKLDQKIETLRTDLRKNEEVFKSDLRSKEIEISALREGVLSGRTSRQVLLEKRRLKAVERVWAAVIELAPYKTVSAGMSIIKFNEIAKRAPLDLNAREFFKTIGSPASGEKAPEKLSSPARNEQPFVSPVAWAFFSAYRAVLSAAYMQAKVLEMGLENPDKHLRIGHVNKLLKETLPHRTDFIDNHDSWGWHHLLDELENKILTELRNMLEGTDIDEASVTQSAKIMKEVNNIMRADEDQLTIAEEADIPSKNSP